MPVISLFFSGIRAGIRLAAFAGVLLLGACNTIPENYRPLTPGQRAAAAPIRFVLSFDDGPSAATWFSNPTETILDALEDNPVQPGIKAVFFIQTRATNGGGTPLGQRLQRREQAAGHVLGLHTATPGHSDQISMKPARLEQMLNDGVADLTAVSGGTPPMFLRPPFWDYNERTFLAYQLHGLHVILTDLSANDGKIYGFNASPTRRSHLRRELADVREKIARQGMPIVDGAIPVIVTFHDVNRYTARHMREYLQILLDSAAELELPVADKPFYDDRQALQRALLARAVQDGRAPVKLPGIWNWLTPHRE
ncbi:polysaccharide deacetylase family protein [Oxalobacteraceae bacterium CAVE-383]|nr:polysaccharide deacetylase family protein [Oxalobacteraceae bacterium CAVE-383]